MKKPVIRWAMALISLVCAAAPALAQIRIGQTAGFTGQVAAGVKETTDGAKLYLDAINKSGGINGQTIELISLDDKFDPALAASNAKKLIDDGVLALFLTRGTPHTQAILPLLSAARIPLIAPSTGSMVLHQPVQPWVFNVRSSYQREAERAVRHLSLIGTTRIGLIHADDAFGADGAAGAMKGFEAVGRQPVAQDTFDRSKPELAPLVAKLIKADAQAVLIIGSGSVVAEAIAKLRSAGSRAQIVTLSNNASNGFIKSLGDNARGTIVTQVFPYERSLSNPMVKEATAMLAATGKGELSPAMLEGFAGAKVLVEGLRRAGPSLSREKLKTALETFRRVDIGGLEVTFTPTDHSGVDYADLSIVGEDGRFKR
ncbi:ABC transporter substrate-binding protein [Ideonella sp.]|uniref:ABC transporter substrate-binding protein n=1 Tax=Ideonella sp. TaxID=1929293 RepID=UPI003BB7C016